MEAWQKIETCSKTLQLIKTQSLPLKKEQFLKIIRIRDFIMLQFLSEHNYSELVNF